MATREQLQNRITEIDAEITSMVDGSEDGKLSSEQFKKFQELRENKQQAVEMLGALPEPVEPPKRISTPEKLKNEATGERPNFLDDPKRGYKSPKEFLTSVMTTYKLGRLEDPRLKSLAAGSDEHSGVNDPYGGFLLPEGFSPDVLTRSPEADPSAGRTQMISMDSPTFSIPYRVDDTHTTSVSGGLTVSRREQTVAITSSRLELKKVKLEATGLFGLAYATEELLTDSPQAFASMLASGFQDEFASAIFEEKLNGTGAGQYQGVNNSGSLVTVTRDTAAQINSADIYAIRSRQWRYSNAIWIANHDTMPELLALNDGTNNIWLPSMRDDTPDMLMGRPLFFSEYMETLGSVGDIGCYDFSQYLEGTLEPLQNAESMHVRFVNHERTFKFWTRNDGRSWWDAALTPRNGSNTLSPFVRLGSA